MIPLNWRVSVAVLGFGLATAWVLPDFALIYSCAAPVSSLPTQPISRSEFVGTSSCSARACHGSLEPLEPAAGSTVRQDEYIKWIATDKKHAGAYEKLFSDRSTQIARNLRDGTGKVLPAHEDSRCLACHSSPALASDPAGNAHSLKDGVSCEACHGPAKEWLADHTSKDWQNMSALQKQRKGMTPTRDLDKRVQVCVGCHVGAPPQAGIPVRDAFHDIMAAGHPRLNFEFGAFLERMPKHWDPSIDETQGPDFDVRAWAIGQVATTRAALKLLEERARASVSDKAPWPEFAEYDCYACHHQLQEETGNANWRQRRGYPGRKPGALPWATWYLPMTRALAECQGEFGSELLTQLNELEKLMHERYPDPNATATQANAIGGLLDRSLDQAVHMNRRSLGRVLADLAELDPPLTDSNWDAAVQLYLALVAFNRSHADEQVRLALGAIFEQLRFPAGYESPPTFHPEPIRAELGKVQPRLGK